MFLFFEFVLRKVLDMGRAGFEPATFRLSVERSSRAELPAHNFVTPKLASCGIKIFVFNFDLRRKQFCASTAFT
jgi:hypothetical protein